MSGGSKKQTVGYWYKLLYHAGLCKGPIDAFLEFRAGDKTAWKGTQTASGTISINQPNLFGGEKDQGGIVGDVDLMFGESTQAVNSYLTANLGAQVPAWRGLSTLVFKGGKYGAMNPYPKPAAYKVRRITQGWNGSCWYADKAKLAFATSSSEIPISTHFVNLDAISNAGNDTAWGIGHGVTVSTDNSENRISIRPNMDAGATYIAISPWGIPELSGYHTGSTYQFNVIRDGVDDTFQGRDDICDGYYAARQGFLDFIGNRILSGALNYIFYINDSPISDNSGGISLIVDVLPPSPFAMNPAHMLYFARTDPDMGREPTANIDNASLTAAADTLYAEGFGLCTTRDPAQESPEEFEQRICKVIDGSFSRDPITGKWFLDLARGNYTLGSLPVLGDDDILEFREVPSTLDNAVNSISVTYFDPEKKEQITTAPVQARGLIAAFGTIHQTIEYLEIPTASLAARVALRELKARATPTRSYELVCTRKPYAWRIGTYFRLQIPKRGIDLVCILGEKNTGSLKSGAIRIKATQDIYTLPAVSSVTVESGVDTRPSQTPVAITLQAAFEAPYVVVVGALDRAQLDVLPVDAGYLLTVAADPAASINYTLMVDSGGGYAQAGIGDWVPTGVTSASATRTTTAVTVTSATRLDQVTVGSIALWESEIVRIDAVNAGTGALTLARGCADTVPADHASGTRLWFFSADALADETEYAAAETVNAKLLTNTASQQLALASATALPVIFADRMVRPYPPANVKIAAADWPATVSGSFTVAWASRNRVTQSDQIVDTSAASITPADNIRYGLRFRRTDTNAVLVERSDIGPPTATVTLTYTGTVSMELWTIDDSNVSWQSHLFAFGYTPPASPTDTITATPYTPVFGGTIIDGGVVT